MRKLIFVGPSVDFEYRQKLSKYKEVLIMPPIQAGDIWKIISEIKNISHILIIDGYFYTKLSVLHKEILSAINQDIKVIGASSLGALRAKELKNFGMIGFGEVYNYYNKFPFTGDDEVGILHSDDYQYKNLTIPLINLRILLNKKIIKDEKINFYLNTLINKLEKVSFSKRSWQYINNLSQKELSKEYFNYPNLLKNYYIDFKSEDAKRSIDNLIDMDISYKLCCANKISINTNGIKNTYKELDLNIFFDSINIEKIGVQSFISFLRIKSFFDEKDIALALFKKLIIEKYQNEISIEKESIEKEIDKLSNILDVENRDQLTSKLGVSDKELEKIMREKLIFSKYLSYKTDDLGIAITNDLLFENLLSNKKIKKLKALEDIKYINEFKNFIKNCLELNNKLGSKISFKYFFFKVKKDFKYKWKHFLVNRNIDILNLFDSFIGNKKN